jgi:hypothetical protein
MQIANGSFRRLDSTHTIGAHSGGQRGRRTARGKRALSFTEEHAGMLKQTNEDHF